MAATKDKYIEAIGRRKTAVARVRLTPAKQTNFVINDATIEDYFKTPALQKLAMEALTNVEGVENFSVSARIVGGGTSAQAEALRLGIARALVENNDALRPALKEKGYLKRDPRMVERKKFGLKGARKRPQWSKR